MLGVAHAHDYFLETSRMTAGCMFCVVSREFEDLLHDKAPLEAYTEWLESMVNRCIILVIGAYLSSAIGTACVCA